MKLTRTVTRETSRHFSNKWEGGGDFLKQQLCELETGAKNKNIRDLRRGLSEFERGYQTKVGKIQKGGGLSVFQACGGITCQMLDIHEADAVRRAEVT